MRHVGRTDHERRWLQACACCVVRFGDLSALDPKCTSACAGLIYGAGSETTANTIATALACIALDPPSLRQLEDELCNLGLLATRNQPTGRTPTVADLRKMTFLDALFHEVLRLFPPAPGGTMRRLRKSVTAEGRTLPRGTVVTVPIWALQRCPAVWGKDAKRWRPGRWLEGRSVGACRKDGNGALRWLPFSGGQQNCIGQYLATVCVFGRVCMCGLVGTCITG
jgi:cytochrome P450